MFLVILYKLRNLRSCSHVHSKRSLKRHLFNLSMSTNFISSGKVHLDRFRMIRFVSNNWDSSHVLRIFFSRYLCSKFPIFSTKKVLFSKALQFKCSCSQISVLSDFIYSITYILWTRNICQILFKQWIVLFRKM